MATHGTLFFTGEATLYEEVEVNIPLFAVHTGDKMTALENLMQLPFEIFDDQNSEYPALHIYPYGVAASEFKEGKYAGVSKEDLFHHFCYLLLGLRASFHPGVESIAKYFAAFNNAWNFNMIKEDGSWYYPMDFADKIHVSKVGEVTVKLYTWETEPIWLARKAEKIQKKADELNASLSFAKFSLDDNILTFSIPEILADLMASNFHV